MELRKPEDKARHNLINPKLEKAGWQIQNYKTANVKASKGVAVEFFKIGQDEADYVLFVDGEATGIIEAKKEGTTLIGKEFQSGKYAKDFPEEFRSVDLPLPFIYETDGNNTRFTNLWDPKPRSRPVFSFHTPETMEECIKHSKETLRARLRKIPSIKDKMLRTVQEEAINNTLNSLAKDNPKALIQMATGTGKTLAAVYLCNELIKKAGIKRVLFLVDRENLGIQAEKEFQTFNVPGDGRKFTQLHNVNRMQNNKIKDSDKVCISTIQRIYSMLLGKEIEETEEEKSAFEGNFPTKLQEIKYNTKVPIETFDLIIVDECHRSIYNLWRQVLEYFDGYIIGLTATPSKSTIAFFNSNLVMEYGHERAVADQVNVDFSVYNIKTKITHAGSKIEKGKTIKKRIKRTRKEVWETLEDDLVYNADALDRKVTSKDQIRKIIRTFKDQFLKEVFPERTWVPKTLIYAKDDNHAEDIVEIVRQEFGEGNEFCVKITYKTEGENPETLISQFRNSPFPRIAVTVDMIATGTDIKPLEIVFFMRAVKSRNYFEQMKGRGVRVINSDEFRAVTPDAQAKERFVIVDAVGVTEIENLNESLPLDRNPSISLEKIIKTLQYGKPSPELISTLVSRLSRLQKKLTDKQNNELKAIAGKSLQEFNHKFIESIDNDKVLEAAKKEFGENPTVEQIDKLSEKRIDEVLKSFIGNSKLLERVQEIKKETEMIIDDVSLDIVEEAGFSEESTKKAKEIVGSFRKFIEDNKKDIAALQLFYHKGSLKWKDLKELADLIRAPPYCLTPGKLWQAYKHLEKRKVKGSGTNKIPDFISLLKFEVDKASELEPYLDTVDKRFAEWLGRQKEQGVKFTEEQEKWLYKIKEHIASSIEITNDDLEDAPFNQMGGLGKAAKVFGPRLKPLLAELNAKVGG